MTFYLVFFAPSKKAFFGSRILIFWNFVKKKKIATYYVKFPTTFVIDIFWSDDFFLVIFWHFFDKGFERGGQTKFLKFLFAGILYNSYLGKVEKFQGVSFQGVSLRIFWVICKKTGGEGNWPPSAPQGVKGILKGLRD